MHEDIERWRRLTILDLLCLFPSFALGAATVRYMMDHAAPDPWNKHPWPMGASIGELLFVSLVLGSVFAGPVSLSVQYLIRKRRTWLTFWEWLWIEPLLLYGLVFLVLQNEWFSVEGLYLYLTVQILCSAVAAIMFLNRLCDFWKKAPCCWTEFLGCFSCFHVGIMMVYLLMAVRL
jgi:hypothetical protein